VARSERESPKYSSKFYSNQSSNGSATGAKDSKLLSHSQKYHLSSSKSYKETDHTNDKTVPLQLFFSLRAKPRRRVNLFAANFLAAREGELTGLIMKKNTQRVSE